MTRSRETPEKTPRIFVTGPPGCGKTTLVERVIRRLPKKSAQGFLTREIRKQGRRVGFALESLDGRSEVLAHVGISSRSRVGRYGVDLAVLERIAVPAMKPSSPETVVVIDEIGKMECLSPLFRRALLEVLASPNPLLATIAVKGPPFIEELKKRRDIILVHLNSENRDETCQKIATRLLAFIS